MFEKASRLNLRFGTSKGSLAVSDLWALPLTSRTGVSLDSIAMNLNKLLKESAEESFVATPTKVNTEMELRFKLVKYIISVRLEENAVKASAKADDTHNAFIDGLIQVKKQEVLQGKSIEELEALRKG